MDNEEHSIAYELLRQAKESSKRLFTICVLELLVLMATIGVFIWYISLPVEEYESTSIEQNTDGNANQVIGIGDSYGNETEDKENELQKAE